jgi:peptidyl-prolyl cis-trans isomerase D
VTEPVDASGYGVDRQLLLPQSQYGEILQTAFSLPAGDRSELMRQANGGYYVVRVNAVTAPRQRTLDEVRGQVTDAWKSEHLHEAKHQYAQSLAKELAATKTAAEAEAVIKRHSLKRTTQVTLRRNGIITGLENTVLPPSLIQEIFEIKNVGKATSAQLMDDHYTIALLRSVKAAADPKTNLQTNQQLQALRRKLRSDYRKEILEQYISHLRTRYPVQINEAVLARLAETNK